MTVDVRRAGDRGRTRTAELDSAHSFSFGHHYDPANTSYGLLLSCNEDVLQPGGGFPPHPHRDVEVLTWVLSGELAHEDSTGRTGVLSPGVVQRMSAGRGVVHSERNAGKGPLRYVQMWLAPHERDSVPSYEAATVAMSDGLVVVASGRPEHAGGTAVGLGQRDAALHVARLVADVPVALPAAAYVHVLVTAGQVELEGVGLLATGDAARIDGGGLRVLSAGRAELLVWEMHSRLSV